MIKLLILAILAVAILLKGARRNCLLAIGLVAISHSLIMSDTPAVIYDWYYFTACLSNLFLILLFGAIFESKEVLRYNVFLVLCILGNFAGWLIWYFYLPKEIYNYYFIALYAGLLITEGMSYVGGIRIHIPFFAIPISGSKCNNECCSGKDKK